MKKTILKLFAVVVTAIISIISITSCNKELDLSSYVSQLRLAVYEGESQNFKAVAYTEKRETPFNADGVVAEIKNAVIIKISFLNGSPNDVTATLSYGVENYETSLTYNPVSEKSTATIYVQNLPTSPSVNLTVTSGDVTEKLTLSSVIFDNTVTYNEALKSVVNSDKERVDKLFNEGNVSAEIHVRLICADGKNYYYIGFVEKGGKTTAYLVDGESAKVIASKSLS